MIMVRDMEHEESSNFVSLLFNLKRRFWDYYRARTTMTTTTRAGKYGKNTETTWVGPWENKIANAPGP